MVYKNSTPPLQKRLHNNTYKKGGLTVLTEGFHLRRGSCCGNRCLHCPFQPKHIKGNSTIALKISGSAEYSLFIEDLYTR